jgi:hypothetical protein
MDEQPKRQVSVGLDEALRAKLEAAAKEQVRTLTGEIVKRLRDSFAGQIDAAA